MEKFHRFQNSICVLQICFKPKKHKIFIPQISKIRKVFFEKGLVLPNYQVSHSNPTLGKQENSMEVKTKDKRIYCTRHFSENG